MNKRMIIIYYIASLISRQDYYDSLRICSTHFYFYQFYNYTRYFLKCMSDISLGIHPRQQSARKQFTQQQVKYFYNSNIFADRQQNYDPTQFDRSQIIKEAKTQRQTYSPPLSPKVQRMERSPQPQVELDIITGMPITERQSLLSKKPMTKQMAEKQESNWENKTQKKKESESQQGDKKYASLYFDNKKQYEQWLKQNKEYEDINYFHKKQPNSTNSVVKGDGNSYFKIHGKQCNQSQHK
ncbi:unnamed protein product (macronuclear) [Paramecium tetraurelia]|uniref:Chromosome undetermined scaffold_1, whole genome shotgun sequence n=1 Tax=Paramecium tetraurelia TaxID=5888 RepID=Q6BG64_PARTE|nr:hypothetical protein [Paramecium tetraurelia strain d4-2]XP_001423335.1 uncharacterized protein GSPATT00000372001 [Paramecium tetraurelia]CAH03356.1 hypotheticl protein [Paramecium tetraurelia]CAK55937.1 unnamed protein product [Paramecium tetraurelia]|eukprot:XP_001423335.1 hypothetical protein (macronuclear) [Paramecium tetraurelia strain d4-2]